MYVFVSECSVSVRGRVHAHSDSEQDFVQLGCVCVKDECCAN